jgi:hypothetical protein
MGWPSDPYAVELDSCISFENVKPEAFEAVPFATLARMPRPRVEQLRSYIETGFVRAPPRIMEMVSAIREGRVWEDAETGIKMAEVSTLSARQISAEMARAQIPVEGLIRKLVEAAATGFISGREMKTSEQLDILKFLTNKVLADSKSQDVDERVTKLDRKKMKSDDMTEDELKRMSAEDLRKLIYDEKKNIR